jgi:spore maturation protein CgeB
LCREWDPDLLVGINYSPDLALLATFVRVPYVSWTIDPLPAGRMAVRNGTEQGSCLLFCHREGSLADFANMDFKDVRPLLLAAPHKRRVPVEDPKLLESYRSPISFVGNSLQDDSAGFTPVLEEHQLERRVDELNTFLESIFDARGHHASWKGLTDPATALPEEFLIYVTADNERVQCMEAANGRLAHLLRMERVKALGDLGIQVWGDAAWDIEGLSYRGIANHGDELTRIYCASQMNLDVPRLYQRDIITMRVFDVMASGGLVLAEQSPELSDCFTSGEELFTYTDTDNLKDMVAKLLKEPEKCKEVADHGRKEVLEKHTLEHRFNVLISACCERGWLKSV